MEVHQILSVFVLFSAILCANCRTSETRFRRSPYGQQMMPVSNLQYAPHFPNQQLYQRYPTYANQNPYGQNPYAQNAYAQNPYGQNPYGQNPYGQNPHEQNSYGQNPYGQNPYDQSGCEPPCQAPPVPCYPNNFYPQSIEANGKLAGNPYERFGSLGSYDARLGNTVPIVLELDGKGNILNKNLDSSVKEYLKKLLIPKNGTRGVIQTDALKVQSV